MVPSTFQHFNQPSLTVMDGPSPIYTLPLFLTSGFIALMPSYYLDILCHVNVPVCRPLSPSGLAGVNSMRLTSSALETKLRNVAQMFLMAALLGFH